MDAVLRNDLKGMAVFEKNVFYSSGGGREGLNFFSEVAKKKKGQSQEALLSGNTAPVLT